MANKTIQPSPVVPHGYAALSRCTRWHEERRKTSFSGRTWIWLHWQILASLAVTATTATSSFPRTKCTHSSRSPRCIARISLLRTFSESAVTVCHSEGVGSDLQQATAPHPKEKLSRPPPPNCSATCAATPCLTYLL
eukprot:5004469-Pleurochrysis_carterae.AAC.6